MAKNAVSRTAEATEAFDYRRAWLMAAIVMGILTWLFWHFFYAQALWAIRQPADWGHTLVVPFIAGYLVYLRREALFAKPFRTTWIAFVPILLGIAWYMLCQLGPQVLWHHNLRAIGVALTISGIVLLFCGWRAMLILWFPLAYLFLFGQTISERFMEIVTFKLQDVTARGSAIFMQLIGMDVERQGNTLYLWEKGSTQPFPLNIAEACSGMRMLMAFLALGVVIAYTGLPRLWQRITLVVLAVPTAVVVNVLRVVTLGQLSRIDPEFTKGEFHTFIGLIWLVPALLIYLGLVWILRQLIIEPEEDSSATATASQNKGDKRV